MAIEEPQRRRNLRHLLGATGRAHHAVYGGPNPMWARWYAEWMYGELVNVLESDPSVDTVETWLIRADDQYRTQEPAGSWPGHYAEWFLAWDMGTNT